LKKKNGKKEGQGAQISEAQDQDFTQKNNILRKDWEKVQSGTLGFSEKSEDIRGDGGNYKNQKWDSLKGASKNSKEASFGAKWTT